MYEKCPIFYPKFLIFYKISNEDKVEWKTYSEVFE
jgi:hypothetical protein